MSFLPWHLSAKGVPVGLCATSSTCPRGSLPWAATRGHSTQRRMRSYGDSCEGARGGGQTRRGQASRSFEAANARCVVEDDDPPLRSPRPANPRLEAPAQDRVLPSQRARRAFGISPSGRLLTFEA